ncbi:MAG TPA: YfhO family protein, partial [Vicinamibacterales bacterium]|nr:YfhO family protein [Vicinamibacterales bacterium]
AAGDPRPLGVFVAWVEVEADGPVPIARSRAASALIVLLLAGVVLAAWDVSALATGAGAMLPACAAAACGTVAWIAIDRLVPTVADLGRGAAWALGAALLALAVRIASAPRSRPHAPPPASANAAVWAAAALVAAVVVVFREALLHGRVLSQADLLYSVFPWRAAMPDGLVIGNRLLADIPLVFYPFLTQVADAFSTGTFPLWSTRLYAGHPFFASFQSALLSPFTWIAVAVPLPWGTVAGAAARVATGGAGAMLFARRIGLGWIASVFCAVAFAFNSFSMIWLEHPLSAVSAWLPWLLWGAEGVADGPRPRATAVLAGVVALTVFAGHPETALKVLACGGLYGLARAAASARPFRVAAWVAFAYALGLLLSAVQVVPFAEYLQVSRTQAVRASITVNPYALPRRVAVGTIVPDFWGHPVSQDYVAQTNSVGAATNYAEQQTYPGVATWVLACVGLATGTTRRWRVWFFAIAALLSAALAFGTPSLIEPLTSLPVLRVTLLSRFALLMIASAIMLASMGLDALVRRADGSAPRLGAAGVAGAVATGVAIAAALWAFRGDLTAAHLLSKATVGGLFSAAVAALIGGLAYGCARGRVAGSAFGVAACVAITAELAAFAAGARSWVAATDVFPSMPAIAMVQRDPGLFRVLGVFDVLPANTAMAYRLADPRGYDGMGPRELSDLLDVSLVFSGSYHMLTHPGDSPLVNLLNVKYVFGLPGHDLPAPQFTRVSGEPSPLFVNRDAIPRLFLADGYTVRTGNLARRTLRDGLVDLHRIAVLESELPAGLAPEASGAGGPGRVDVRHYRDHFVEVTTTAAGRRLLVFTDLYYPGWIAEIDGRATDILRADFAFRAVSVPGGTHTVRFRYRPASVAWGMAASALALAVAMALFWRGAYGRFETRTTVSSVLPGSSDISVRSRTADGLK